MTLPAKVTRDPSNVGTIQVLGKGRRQRSVTPQLARLQGTQGLPRHPAADLRGESVPDEVRSWDGATRHSAGGREVRRRGRYPRRLSAHPVPHLRHTLGQEGHEPWHASRRSWAHLAEDNLDYVALARNQMDQELQENAL